MSVAYIVRDKNRPRWRLMAMAEALGISIPLNLYHQRLDPERYGDMVENCATCTWAEACALWAKGEGRGTTAPPEICANRDILSGLRV